MSDRSGVLLYKARRSTFSWSASTPPTFLFIRSPIPTQEVGKALVTQMGLRMLMGGGDHPFFFAVRMLVWP
ncbi:hypothetical protein EVAR_27514_1 [Eumeta japonica]|uniref:Uncharacterized protein n=1 Tax=Eumeta variegata TaxID=151549 RepID=A0A4C1W6U1_EUMVA|nr:hypothetical protein EVAR_27514_1 [Eumeta japonica]